MASKDKGKAVVDKWSPGKRKRECSGGFGGRGRRNPEVLKLFDVSADVCHDDGSEDSELDDFLLDEEEVETDLIDKNEPRNSQNVPFLPKQEDLCGEELERVLDERYRDGSGLVSYADDIYDSKRSIDKNLSMHSAKDPTIWKLKCVPGRERYSVFCLMEKYANFKALGKQLQIISAFAVEYIKGFIFIEANRQSDINEACNGICSIYFSRITPVPGKELYNLLSIRSKSNEISVGTWARVKNGHYKGDLAEVVAVNDKQKKVTVRLIPRINLQTLIEKLGGGVPTKRKNAPPAPRLVSRSELEEFAPLIQHTHDKETGMDFDVLDGMRLKNGFIFKKVSIESLNLWGVNPLKEELENFKHSAIDQSEDAEWLNQLFGEQKRKRSRVINLLSDKGGAKCGGKGSEKGIEKNSGKAAGNVNEVFENFGEEDLWNTVEKGSEKSVGKGGEKGVAKGGEKSCETSERSVAGDFDIHDFVCFGRKDFGVIVGMEKDNVYRILKEGPTGQVVVTAESRNMKHTPFDKKFTSLDQQMRTVSINDTVRIADGPSQGKEGVVKQIYRGILFLYDENETENNGFFCSKSVKCDKINHSGGKCNEKADKAGLLSFGDFSTSPKPAPLPMEQQETEENNNEYKRKDRDGLFSVGQALRIKKGPLKGYLCRVLGIWRSMVTVKLDSQPKVLSVDAEHLSMVQEKNSLSTNVDLGSSLLVMEGGSTDWMEGGGATAAGSSWNALGNPSERSTWSNIPASSTTPESNSENPISFVDNDSKADTGDDNWGRKVTQKDSSSGVADEIGAWGQSDNSLKSGDPWDKGDVSANPNSSWEIAKPVTTTVSSSWGNKEDSTNKEQGAGTWGKSMENSGQGGLKENMVDFNSGTSHEKLSSGWDAEKSDDATGWTKSGINNELMSSWKKPDGIDSSWNKVGVDAEDESKSQACFDENWAKPKSTTEDEGSTWKQGGGSSWGESARESSFEDQAGGSSWGKQGGQMNNETGEKNNWGSSKSFEGERGFGGRRGRGGFRGGRGRSFGEDHQSGGWNKGENPQNSWSGGEKKPSSWNSEDQGNGWNNEKTKVDDGKQSEWNVRSTENNGGNGWNESRASDGGVSSSAWGENVNETSDGWNKNKNQNTRNLFGNVGSETDANRSNRGRGGHWRGGRGRGNSEQGGFRGRGGFDRMSSGGRGGDLSSESRGQRSGWGAVGGDQNTGWKQQDTIDNQKSGWNTNAGKVGGWGSEKTSDGGSGGQLTTGWGNVKTSDSGAGWGSGKVSEGGATDLKSTGWGNGKTSEGGAGVQVSTSWGSGGTSEGGAGGNVTSGWGDGKTSDGGAGANATSGWGSGNTLNSGAGGKVSSSWGSGNTSDGGAGGNVTSGWGSKNTSVDGAGGNVTSGWGSGKSSDDSAGGNATSGWGCGNTSDGGAVGKVSSSWGSGSTSDDGSGGKVTTGWGSGNTSDGGAGGNVSSGWGSKNTSDGGDGGNATSGWGSGNTSDGVAGSKVRIGWGSGNTSDGGVGGNVSSGWGSKNTSDGGGKSTSGWGSGNTSDGGGGGKVTTGWGSGNASDGGAGDNVSSGWGSKNSSYGGAGGNVTGGWGSGNTSDGGAGGNVSSGWGSKSTYDGGAGGKVSSGWGGGNTSDGGGSGSGRGGSKNWKGEGEAGGGEWSQKSKWNSSNAGEEEESNSSMNWKGGRGGRGSFDRGGRGRFDRGGRGRFDGGGFRGRGNSERGGFRGRGRFEGRGGRGYQSGGSNDAPNTWSQGGGSTWKPPSVPENNAGDSWSQGAGSSWKQPSSAPENIAGDSSSQGGASSWKSSAAPANNCGSSWKPSNAPEDSAGNSWKPSSVAEKSGGDNSWNQGGDGSSWSQGGGSSWKQSNSPANNASDSGVQGGGSTWNVTPKSQGSGRGSRDQPESSAGKDAANSNNWGGGGSSGWN